MRFAFIIILFLTPAISWAQNHFCGKQLTTSAGGFEVEYAFNTTGTFDTSGAYYWFDWSQSTAGASITSNEGTYVWNFGGTKPDRNNDGTWPSGIGGSEGWMYSVWQASSGVTSVATDLDLGTSWTYVVILTEMASNAIAWHIRKLAVSPSLEGFQFGAPANYWQLTTWESGSSTVLNKTGALNNGQISCAVTTFDGSGGTGASTGTIYVDELASASSSTMNPVGSGSAVTYIATGSGSLLRTSLHYLAYYNDTTWTETKSRNFCRDFYGLGSDSGTYMSITSATPAATFLTSSGGPNYLVSTSTNNGMVGAYGWYAHPTIDNLIHYSSFETDAMWTTTLVAGDGSAASDWDGSATAAHGFAFEKMTLTGTTSSATIASNCITSGIASDLYVQVQAMKGSGTSQAAIRIHEYSDATCSTSLGTTDIRAAGDLTTSWAEYGGLFGSGSWNGSTSSWTIEMIETCNGGCTTYWDAIQAVSASNPTDSYCVVCDTGATCSCTLANATIPQLLTNEGWSIQAKIRSPIDGAVVAPWRRILTVPGTAGDNNRVDFYWSNDQLILDVYDSGGTKKTATVAAAGNADTEYTAYAEHTAGGVIKVCWNGGCGSTTSGANMATISTTCRIGHDGTNGGEVWIKNLELKSL